MLVGWRWAWWKVNGSLPPGYVFGHLRADCRGPGSAPEPYARFEYGTILPFTTSITTTTVLPLAVVLRANLG